MRLLRTACSPATARQRREDLDPPGPDEGLTLVELMVSMAITSLILALGGIMLVSTLRQRAFSDDRATSQADARLIVERVSRDLRVAVPPPDGSSKSAFAYLSNQKIIFYSMAGGATPVISKITYEVDPTSKCLRRTTIQQVGTTFPTASAVTRCLAPALINTGGETLFSFFRLRTDATSSPTQITPPTGGYSTPGDEAAMKVVASLRLTLWVQAQGSSSSARTTVDQWVTLINQSNALRTGAI
jgi:prepilin-type N-terminal cleavage/methylation domain-containing protein